MEFRQATLLENGNQNCKILTQILPLRMTVLSVETFQKLKKLLYVEYAFSLPEYNVRYKLIY